MRTARLRLLLKERITPRSVLRFSPPLALGFTLVVVLQSVAILNQWFDSGAALAWAGTDPGAMGLVCAAVSILLRRFCGRSGT